MEDLSIQKIKDYWKGKRVPQQWYSNKEPLSLQWFNEISFKRFTMYYPYLKEFAEFKNHHGENVLEIGCGVGTDTVEYSKNGAKISAIDLGEDQIKLTKLNLELRGLKYENIKVANVEELDFHDKSFDLVYCFGVLHHTKDINKAVNEIYRVLKDDGHALIMLYSRGWKHYIKRCFIQGILKGKIFKYNFDWQKLYNEISEVHGNSPMTLVLKKKEIIKLFKDFATIEISKDRLGEFFEYKPYNSVMFPKFISKIFYFFSLEKFLGENWKIKVSKTKKEKESLKNVLFKKY